MVKKQEELKPEAIKKESFTIELDELKKLSGNIDKFDFDIQDKGNDTFYKLAIEKLFDGENIETKTEFLNPAEVFSATKLQFLGNFADIPLLTEFISALERKRISLLRKGREEIILALQERKQEEMEIRKQQMLNMGRVM